MSIGVAKKPEMMGEPRRRTWWITIPLSASALACTMAPARVTGALAPITSAGV